MQSAWKNRNSIQSGILETTLFAHQKRKINNFPLKKPTATKDLMFNIWDIITIFFIEYILIGIVKPKEMKYDA